MTYTLHYAPDNASLIIRLALEQRGLPYITQLVDRTTQQQTKAAYRELNPNGLIPVLETPQGPLFETARSCCGWPIPMDSLARPPTRQNGGLS